MEVVLGIVAYRALPMVIWATLMEGLRWPFRALIAVVFFAIAYIAYSTHWSDLLYLLAFGVYYGIVACGVHGLSQSWQSVRMSGLAVLAALVGLCLLGPTLIAFPHGTASTLVPGWLLLLSSYSYLADVRRGASVPPMREGVRFLLVDPTLVFADRGKPVPRNAHLMVRGIARCSLGVTSLSIGVLLLNPIRETIRELVIGRPTFDVVLETAALVVFGFAAEYAMHSGVASLNIGFMAQMGYRVGEQFNYPFLAVSPLDFWRRWNIYVGSWARRYVFTPLAVHRTWRQLHLSSTTAKLCAGLSAFAVVGLLHDVFYWCATLEMSTRWLCGFSIAAAGAFGWHGAERSLAWLLPSWRPSHATALVSRIGMVITLVFAVMLWRP
jgi:hypothetical protein